MFNYMTAKNHIETVVFKRQKLGMRNNQVRNRMWIHEFAGGLVSLLSIPTARKEIDINIAGWSTAATDI